MSQGARAYGYGTIYVVCSGGEDREWCGQTIEVTPGVLANYFGTREFVYCPKCEAEYIVHIGVTKKGAACAKD